MWVRLGGQIHVLHQGSSHTDVRWRQAEKRLVHGQLCLQVACAWVAEFVLRAACDDPKRKKIVGNAAP